MDLILAIASFFSFFLKVLVLYVSPSSDFYDLIKLDSNSQKKESCLHRHNMIFFDRQP